MTDDTNTVYRGRFAPSPTGPLHFGSLIAALGSLLDARTHGGQWLVRIEDLDPPREVPGATQSILDTLAAFGMQADGEVLLQSDRTPHYEAALQRLQRLELVYPCGCSRRDIQDVAGALPGIYPGTCRNGLPPGREARAVRLRVPEREIVFRDRLQGEIREWLPTGCGDFVLRRADGLFAYQLAVVVDDALQGITHVVRGADLLGSTPRQILLQRLLGYPEPAYLHLPVIANRLGEKLSKQTHAAPLDAGRAPQQLCDAARFLGLQPPAALSESPVDDFWRWATAHWDVGRLPRQRLIRQH